MGERKRNRSSGKENARTLRAMLRIAQLQAFVLAIGALALLIAVIK